MMRDGFSLSVHPHAFLQDGWLDFLHITYHYQVPCGADARETELGSEPNSSNYGNVFNNFRAFVVIA